MGRGYLNVPWGLVKEGLISTNSGTSLVDVPIPLLKDAWVEADGKYTQTITMEGIKADSNPMIVLSSLEEEPTVEEMDAFACLLDETVVEDGSITFVASSIPAISFTVIARGDMKGDQAVAEVMKLVAKVDELENEIDGLNSDLAGAKPTLLWSQSATSMEAGTVVDLGNEYAYIDIEYTAGASSDNRNTRRAYPHATATQGMQVHFNNAQDGILGVASRTFVFDGSSVAFNACYQKSVTLDAITVSTVENMLIPKKIYGYK